MPDNQPLPPVEQSRINLGYMRLTDSAPLILAREYGLFEKYGLDVQLQREVSWANLRDRLVAGHLDAAQLLAPLPFATALGAGGLRARLLTGLSLGLNGNAITVSRNLRDRMPDVGEDAATRARGLAALMDRQSLKGRLTFATVHAFSMHSFLLRMWLRSGGIDPDHDVRLIVLPPEQMCDSLARGIIDGFCVGAPWSSVAVQRGIGTIVTSGYQIWNNAPEKVLGVTEKWHDRNPGTHLRLRLATMEACRLLDEETHRHEAATILSSADYLDLPEDSLSPSLNGLLPFSKNGEAHRIPGYHVFWEWQACFPWRSHARWIMQYSSALLGKTIDGDECRALVRQCYRGDLYRDAARHLGVTAPTQDDKPEDAHDGPWTFEPGITLGPDRMLGST